MSTWRKAIPRRHDWIWFRILEENEDIPVADDKNPGGIKFVTYVAGDVEVVDPKNGRHVLSKGRFYSEYKPVKPDEEHDMLTHWG